MLQGINRIGRSWLGKVVVAVLFGFLIISFAIWGIGDIFRGGVRTTVATVGKTDISAEAFRNAYQNDLQRLMRQTRQSITPERARALGLDTQALGRLVTEAALDQKARELGLAISDELVARAIREDPSFRGANGQFERSLFQEVLRSNGLTEAGYVREQRNVMARLELAEAVTGALNVPVAMREALYRYGAERRAATYLTLGAGALGEIAAPSEEQLKSYFEANKSAFRAPETRALNVVALSPENLAKPDEVSDEDARKHYDEIKASRFGKPERRTVQQIVFPSKEEAEAASKRIKEGTSFEAVAAERGIDDKTLELGTFAKAEMFDPAVADAVFSLADGAVSAPIDSRFGTVLVRVTRIEPASIRPFEEVAAEVKREIALERARNQVETVHDSVEDMRASARPLADIAREKGLTLISVPAVDRDGRDKAGQPVALPDRDALLAAAFASDVGVDNEPLRTRGSGYVWYEVTSIDPARDKTLAEVRDAVEAGWRKAEVQHLLADKAGALAERIDKGETVEAVATELGLQANTASDLARGTAKSDLPADAVMRIFATPVGKAGSAASGEEARILFKVTAATVPPFLTTIPEAAQIEERLRLMLGDDLLAEYIAKVQQDLGVTVYQQNLRRAAGGEL